MHPSLFHRHIFWRAQIKSLFIVYFLKAFGSGSYRKWTVRFSLSFYTSRRMQQLGSGATDFHETWYCAVVIKSVHTFHFGLKSVTVTGDFHGDLPVCQYNSDWVGNTQPTLFTTLTSVAVVTSRTVANRLFCCHTLVILIGKRHKWAPVPDLGVFC